MRMDSQFIQNLLDVVKMATQLQMLNLSNNEFCQNDKEKLYAAWSSSRAGLAQSNILDNVIYLSVQRNKCCGVGLVVEGYELCMVELPDLKQHPRKGDRKPVVQPQHFQDFVHKKSFCI